MTPECLNARSQSKQERYVLVVTERLDPHVDFMADKFHRRGFDMVRLHLSDFPQFLDATLRWPGERHVQLSFLGREYRSDDFVAVWYRRTERPMLPPTISEQDRRFAANECQAFISAIWQALPDVTWVSPPRLISSAGIKFEQLRRASQWFRTPQTCFTNSPASIREFVDAMGGPENVIYKPHTSTMFDFAGGSTGVVYTTRLSLELMECIEQIKLSPGIFQEFISKTADLRVTVVGNTVFGTMIDSQNSRETDVDWRGYSWNGDKFPSHTPLNLDGEFERGCIEFVESYGMNFGCLDFAIEPSGDLMFLENNPNGQWAWIEQTTGQPIGDALADFLTKSAP